MKFYFSGHSIHLDIGKVHFGAGLFYGDPWRLIAVTLLQADEGWFSVFDIAVLKFQISLGVS